MITVFSKDHHLHFGKYELIDGKFVTPFEHAEPIPGPLTGKLSALAGEKNTVLIAFVFEERTQRHQKMKL